MKTKFSITGNMTNNKGITTTILKFIKDNPGAKLSDITLNTNYTQAQVSNALDRLAQKQQIMALDKDGRENRWVCAMALKDPVASSTQPRDRYVPPNMDIQKHWTHQTYIPPERLLAFKLPSIVSGERVIPKAAELYA